MHLLKFQSRFCQNFLPENILGELSKRQPNETTWRVRLKRTIKHQKEGEPSTTGGRGQVYLILGIGGLAVSAVGIFLSARGDYGLPPAKPGARAKASPQPPLYGLKFQSNIYNHVRKRAC